MDPHLVLNTVSIFHNKSVLFVNREIIRIIRETFVKPKGKVFKEGV